jgi:hypothetical protein
MPATSDPIAAPEVIGGTWRCTRPNPVPVT